MAIQRYQLIRRKVCLVSSKKYIVKVWATLLIKQRLIENNNKKAVVISHISESKLFQKRIAMAKDVTKLQFCHRLPESINNIQITKTKEHSCNMIAWEQPCFSFILRSINGDNSIFSDIARTNRYVIPMRNTIPLLTTTRDIKVRYFGITLTPN